MSGFIIFPLILLLIYCTISWILPKLLAWLFERKFKVFIRIGRIGVPYLKLCDIHVVKEGFTVHIDEIGIKSSFFNSELTKLVTLVAKDVRINKDVLGKSRLRGNKSVNVLDFRNKKIPHFITTFAQFMAVHIYNISTMLLHSQSPGWLVHATANELHIDGSIVQNARTLLVNVTLTEASAKLLKHPEKQVSEETCLGQLSFAISMEATLVAQGPLSVEKLHICTSQTAATIKDGFYSLVQENRIESHDDVTSTRAYDNLYSRILPVIPKNFTYKMEDVSVRGVRENSRTEFMSTLKTFTIDSRFVNPSLTMEELLPHMYYSFQLTDLRIYNNKDELLLLKSLTLDAKLQRAVIDLYLKLDTLSLIYNHDAIHRWIHTNFLRNNYKLNPRRTNRSKGKNANVLENLLKKLMINGCAEFCQVSALMNLNGNNSYVGFNHVKWMLDQASERRETVYDAFLPNLLLSNRHWQTEVLMECLWWSFKEWKREPTTSKKIHVWNTPIFLGMTLFKFGTYGSTETKIESLLDTLQLEWSPNLVSYIHLAIRCFRQYRGERRNVPVKDSGAKLVHSVVINFALSHFNLFLFTNDNEYLVTRLNSLVLDKSLQTVTANFKGLKLATVTNNDRIYNCIRTEDIQDYSTFVRLAQVEINNSTSAITVHLFEEIIGHWSTNLHLKMLTLTREIRQFLQSIEEKEYSEMDRVKDIMEVSWNLRICGNFAFHIRISEKHCAKITLDNIVITKHKEDLSISNNTAIIAIDGSDIFTIQGLTLCKIENNSLIEDERLDNENFHLKWNKTWGLTVELFKVTFPHEHFYAEAVQGEFISIWKWLKIVHDKKKVPFTVDSPLPSDLFINIKDFLFEMSDDPFEVKLRDNYELLEDEYNESLKRQNMLKSKISELCKTHLHLPAGKVEELYANLSKKNAEIYIQRSKQMLHAAPARTRLFAWNMTNIEIMILADPSIHGADNVIKVMREIDFETPWPEEPMEFSTLWCRVVSLRCKEWKFQLRDFRQPLLNIRQCYVCGQLVGAEQMALRRAIRDVTIDLGNPWGSATIERSMLPLKFYHDFNCEIESYSYAFGPCWESVIAQCNLTFERIIAPSRDPSPPLPFWDKMRLLLHGRLTMIVQQLTVLLHASLDPYNTTEEMELTWSQVVMDWTNAKFVYKGDLNIFVRTASKYDDCKLLHLPNLKLIVDIQWACLGDPNDHHSIIQCAPDKIPEYSSNQVHDSFRAFRSQNINLGVVLETRPITNQSPTGNVDYPTLSLYSSTLRWIENLKLILSGVTRPTKRGKIFNNVRPRKIQLSRHYKRVHLLMGLHKFQVCYWMSFAMQRGFELLGGRLSSSAEHMLSLVPVDDGLKHRPKAEWSIVYMNSELNDTEIWLKSALQEDPEKEAISLRQPVEKCFCLSVAKVSYGRETVLISREHSGNERNKDTPTHRLVVYDLKGAWTKSNRNVAFALFDSFMRNQRMKKNLSTEALKGFRKESNSTPLKHRNNETAGTPTNPTMQLLQSTVQDAPSPLSKIQSGHAANMLKQLIAEADNKAVVFSDDLSSATRQQHLQGLQACQEDDVLHKNWLIALVNAQVLLKGCETKGYVILSSAKAEILQRVHRPVWKNRALVSKTTWVGSLECLQYYATVNAGENDTLNENIMWLTVDNIQEKESTVISEIPQVPNIVGSGVSVGAVVSDVVGASSNAENWPIQLQRIVSRCKCEFFYCGYGDISIDPEELGEVPPPLQEDIGLWDRRQTAVDAFTLMHHDLDVCTNSLQYAMLLDIVNNLLLYVEPHRKEALERLTRMRFKLQLHSVQDQRRPIQSLQNQIRSSVSKLRRLEKETYLVNKAVAEEPNNLELLQEMENLEELVYNCKGQLNGQSEELDMMISCYNESQLLANSRMATTRSDKPLTMVRANEICFKHAQWRLTEADGQIGIADLVLSNFLYTKNSKSDDSVEHLLELGYVRMTNLLPNQIYKEVLLPTEIQSNMPVEHKRVVRVFCREKPPVGGISVKEHFEINVVPLTIGLTKKFYNTMLKFCFPEKDPDNIEGERGGEDIESEARGKRYRSSGRGKRDSNFYIPIDDVEKMKERAEKNKLFIYIKIPEVPVRVSYKGNKEKNLEDIRDFSLVIPTLEYHNVTWTWLDLLLAMKSDTRRVILSQAIKQKLQIKRSTGMSDESSSPQEEDKARLLFGAHHLNENRSTKKGMSSVFKFGK